MSVLPVSMKAYQRRRCDSHVTTANFPAGGSGEGDAMSSAMPLRSGLVVANPAAGGVTPELVRDVQARCSRWLPAVRVLTTCRPGEVREIAAGLAAAGVASRPDVVIVVGGDGSVSEAAAGLRAARLGAASPPLLVVPAGTGNSFYREVWDDRPWQQMIDGALGGMAAVRWIDMARIPETGTDVLLGACSGLVAEALAAAAGIAGIAGRDKYDRAVAATMATFAAYPGRVTIDGVQAHPGPAVLANVGGGRHRGGRHTLLPHSVLDDGLLDVCVVGGGMDLRELPLLTASGTHVGHPAVTYGRGRSIRIERTDGMPLSFEHDGELFPPARTSYTVEVMPRSLPVLSVAASEN
jgi:diacylglycerol kinase (ATP)